MAAARPTGLKRDKTESTNDKIDWLAGSDIEPTACKPPYYSKNSNRLPQLTIFAAAPIEAGGSRLPFFEL